MPDSEHVATPEAQVLPRLHQELNETLQRLRLGGPFYVLLWGLAGLAADLWQRAPVTFVSIGLCFVVLAYARFRIRNVEVGAGAVMVSARLDQIWRLLLANAALWGVSAAWLLWVTADESARTVAAVSSYAFATAFAHNFPMRLRAALLAVGLIFVPTLAGFIANGSRFELVAVGVLYMLYVSLALRRSHAEYLQRLDLEAELRTQRDLYEQQSRRDALTGLANRRRFTALMEEWAASAGERAAPLSLMILDLDHFKAVNDLHGHAAGDASLRAFAAKLQEAFPGAHELVARLGGEEFGVLLCNCTMAAASLRAESFRQQIAAHPFKFDVGELQLSVSIGVAELDPRRVADGEALYHAADTALYRAKAAGRNTVRQDLQAQ